MPEPRRRRPDGARQSPGARSTAPDRRSRRLHRAGPGTVRLWTLQPAEVWTSLQDAGILYVEEHRIPELDDYRAAYAWMREQMRRRIPGCEGRYPWWAYDYKLDLRLHRYQFGLPGARCVRLALAVPERDVLLSAYGAWHAVLNGWYLPYTVDAEYLTEAAAWTADLKSQGLNEWDRPLAEPFWSRMVRSWERIFDVEELRETNTIQATFECLRLEDVVAVTEFTAGSSRVALDSQSSLRRQL